MKISLFPLFFLSWAFSAQLILSNALAAPGDLYVSEPANGVISKFTPTGNKTTFASGLDAPQGLAFDRAGNLFVAEGIAGTILRFTPIGEMSVFATGLSLPGALAFDGAGNLFVTESFGDTGRISKITPAGTKSVFASGANLQAGLAFDISGNLFAPTGGPTDFDGGIIWFTPDGTRHTLSFTDGPGMAFDSAGNLYISSDDDILRFTPLPAHQESVFVAGFNNAGGLAFDAANSLFVGATGSGGASIFRVAPDGMKTTFATGFQELRFFAFEPVTEKLRNISARGLVQNGDNVLIGGFIIGGNALANNSVLLRAIGPSLSHDGIANPLQDPRLELHNSSGALIASNDNWQQTQNAQITATGLAPSDAHESAIFAILPAGAYTAVVRGAPDTTGLALVEVYSLSK